MIEWGSDGPRITLRCYFPQCIIVGTFVIIINIIGRHVLLDLAKLSLVYVFEKEGIQQYQIQSILQCPTIKKNSQIHEYKALQRPNNICYIFEKQGHIVSFTNPLASSQADTLSRVTHTVLYIVLFHFTFYQTSINKYFINEDISGKYEINI